jgi:NAD dependent epimerase/dehydratase family enzyme
VNLTAPTPATSGQVTSYLAKRMRRPHLFRIPAWVIRTFLGDAGEDLLLTSENIVPERLVADGFEFRHPTVESAIDAMLSRVE